MGLKNKNKMKKVITILSVAILVLTSCNRSASASGSDNSSFGSSSNEERPKTAEELKAELKQQEVSNPNQYLSVEGSTLKPNMVREAGLFRDAEYDGWIVAGTIKNTATVARYKDIVLTIQLFSQTGTVIETNDYTVYEFYEPNSSKQFSFKINAPDAMEKFNVSINTAVGQ